MTGKSANPPYDGLPVGFDGSKAYHLSAWFEVIPNFPFAGQMWAKDRYRIGMKGGRQAVGKITGPKPRDTTWLSPEEYPPESETADKFEWDPDLLARWKTVARKHGNRPPWWEPPRRRPAAGYLWI